MIDVGEPGPLTYEWSGASCGETEANGNTYVWDHAGSSIQLSGGLLGNRQLSEDECGHAEDPNHSGTTITVLVNGPTMRATCVYQGILSGVGPDCTTVQIVNGQPLPPQPAPVDPPPVAPTASGDPVAEAIDRSFAGGASVAWSVDVSAGNCSEFPKAYQQSVTIAGAKSLNEMTLSQSAHAPAGGYPEQHSTVLLEGGADSERYVIEFYLDGEELAFRGVYRYQDRCDYEINGQLG